jgi:hypothetical protein
MSQLQKEHFKKHSGSLPPKMPQDGNEDALGELGAARSETRLPTFVAGMTMMLIDIAMGTSIEAINPAPGTLTLILKERSQFPARRTYPFSGHLPKAHHENSSLP